MRSRLRELPTCTGVPPCLPQRPRGYTTTGAKSTSGVGGCRGGRVRRLDVPTIDDRPLYDAYIANRASAALAVAVHLGWFARLEQGVAISALAEANGFSHRGVRLVLVALH